MTVSTVVAGSLAGVTLFPFAPCAFCSSLVWLALGFACTAKDRAFKMLFPQSACCRFFSSWTFSESPASGNQNSVTGLLFFHPFFLFSPLTPIRSNSAFDYYSANTGCLLSPSPLLFRCGCLGAPLIGGLSRGMARAELGDRQSFCLLSSGDII